MARTIGTNPIDSDTATTVYLIRLGYWNAGDFEVRFTNAPVDLTVNVGDGPEVWTGTGLLVNVSTVAEGSDLDVSGVDITFDGVDQTVIGIIMNNHFRSQPIKIYKAWYSYTDGLIEGTPILYFDGYQMDSYTVSESSTDEPDAVSVTTRATNRLARTTAENTVMTNPRSHLNMLNRIPGNTDTTANFFVHIPTIIDLEVYWGEDKPVRNKGYDPGLPYDPNKENPWVGY